MFRLFEALYLLLTHTYVMHCLFKYDMCNVWPTLCVTNYLLYMCGLITWCTWCTFCTYGTLPAHLLLVEGEDEHLAQTTHGQQTTLTAQTQMLDAERVVTWRHLQTLALVKEAHWLQLVHELHCHCNTQSCVACFEQFNKFIMQKWQWIWARAKIIITVSA